MAELDGHGMAALPDDGLAELGSEISAAPLSGRRSTTRRRWGTLTAVIPE